MINEYPNFVIGMTLDELEKRAIEYCMRHFDGNKLSTANALGISLRTIDNKLKKYADEKNKVEVVSDERKSLTPY